MNNFTKEELNELIKTAKVQIKTWGRANPKYVTKEQYYKIKQIAERKVRIWENIISKLNK